MTAQQQWLLEDEDDGLDSIPRDSYCHDGYEMTTAEIAAELGCSEHQVIYELKNIYRKLRRLARRDPEWRMAVRSVLGRVP